MAALDDIKGNRAMDPSVAAKKPVEASSNPAESSNPVETAPQATQTPSQEMKPEEKGAEFAKTLEVDAPQTSVIKDGPLYNKHTVEKPGTPPASGIGQKPDLDSDAVMGLDQQIKAIEAADADYEDETPEQRRKRERRESAKRKIAAVADGLSALSNLFFTSQYAPNSFDPSRTMSGTVRNRLEELRKDREAKRDRHISLQMKIGDLKNKKAQTLRDLKAQQEAQRLARKKEEREDDLHPLVKAIKEADSVKAQNLAEMAGYDAESSRLESENKPEELRLKNENLKAGIGQKEAAAGASRASAGKSNAQARYYGKKVEEGIWVDDGEGNLEFLSDEYLDDAFAELPDDVRKKAGDQTSVGNKKPNKAQQRQAVAKHRRDMAVKGSGGKGKGYGGNSGKGKGYGN